MSCLCPSCQKKLEPPVFVPAPVTPILPEKAEQSVMNMFEDEDDEDIEDEDDDEVDEDDEDDYEASTIESRADLKNIFNEGFEEGEEEEVKEEDFFGQFGKEKEEPSAKGRVMF